MKCSVFMQHPLYSPLPSLFAGAAVVAAGNTSNWRSHPLHESTATNKKSAGTWVDLKARPVLGSGQVGFTAFSWMAAQDSTLLTVRNNQQSQLASTLMPESSCSSFPLSYLC